MEDLPLVDPHEYRNKVFEWAEKAGFKTLRLVIFQPEGHGCEGVPKEWTCSFDELEAFAKELHLKVDATRVAEVQHKTMPFEKWWPIYLNPEPTEEDCMFCKAQSICPSKKAKLEREMALDFAPVEEGQPITIPDPTTFGQQKLSRAMAAVGELEDFCKAIRAEMERRLLAGVEDETFGLGMGRAGNRTLSDPRTVEEMLRKRFRLSFEEVYHFSLKSVKQLEESLVKQRRGGPAPKLKPRQWAQVEKFITRAPGKPSVMKKTDIKNPYNAPQLTADGFEPVKDEEDMS